VEVAERDIMVLISFGVRFGFFERSKAHIPDTIGAAKEVPFTLLYTEPFPLT
jgi:hypothetical protein